MTDETTKPHTPPFLEELDDNAVLDAAILRGPVAGPALIKKVVATVGGMFASQSPGLHAVVDKNEFVEYNATLPDGTAVNGLVVITRNDEGKVVHVGSMIRPLNAVLAVATILKERLASDLHADLFL